MRLEEKECRGAKRANSHYAHREVNTNLLACILGDWCCGVLLLQVRVQRMSIKSERVPKHGALSTKLLLLSVGLL